ncbi:hypothetical protein VHEMI10270 [[Torrubiella] hemipterigena]|uniref:MalT-like TPR region domain-containing protein n=1 Tax=[Torrubiella] hemipterigena TaxID=1531966 RepID=A0A0A1TCK3_9HYPO|nr:hypothetical protein VHEMI10270 [[Torrubiella] hemipterigena]
MANLAKADSGSKELDEAEVLLADVVQYIMDSPMIDDIASFEHFTDWAVAGHALGKPEEAENFTLSTIALYKERVGDKDPRTIKAPAMLGTMYQAAGKYAEAEEIIQKALAARGDVFERVTLGLSNIQLHKSLEALSIMYFEAKRTKDAIKITEELLVMRQTYLRIDDAEIILTMARLGSMYYYNDQYVEAKDMLSKGLPMMQTSPDIRMEDTLPFMTVLGHSQNILGQHNEAIVQWSALLVLLRDMGDGSDSQIGNTLLNLASAYCELGESEKAEELYVEGIAMQQKNNRGEEPHTITSMHALGSQYYRLKLYVSAEECLDFLSNTQFFSEKYNDAEETISELIKVRREVLGETHAEIARSMFLLGETYLELENGDEAVKAFVQVLEAQLQGLVIPGIPMSSTLKILAALYEYLGQVEAALAMLALLHPIQIAELGDGHPDSIQTATKMMQFVMSLLSVVGEEETQHTEL